MAEMFTAFFVGVGKALGGLATAATGGAGGGAGAAAGAVATGGGFLKTLSAGLTIVSGLGKIVAGQQQSAALKQQAMDEDLRASQEELNGREDALKAMEKLNQDMARISVAGFASGLTSGGSVDAAQQEAERIADANLSVSRSNAQINAAARRGQARQLRYEADGAALGGILGFVSDAGSLFSRRAARG